VTPRRPATACIVTAPRPSSSATSRLARRMSDAERFVLVADSLRERFDAVVALDGF
jgi:hypothetical protein